MTPAIQSIAPDAGIDSAVAQRVERMLTNVEAEHNLRVLFACESGSRAWGFASTDSDYDVRFIYARPIETYLHLHPPTDAFDLPMDGEMDLAGWDIRKTAELMRKSNPPLMEWLDSPIIYHAHANVLARLRELRATYFDAKKAAYHYLSMARNVWSAHLEGEPHPVRKKYLYALRPLAAIRYIALHRTCPPTRFADVLAAIDFADETMAAIHKLVDDKSQATEIGAAPADAALNAAIEQGLADAEQVAADLPPSRVDTQPLNALIADVLLNRAAPRGPDPPPFAV